MEKIKKIRETIRKNLSVVLTAGSFFVIVGIVGVYVVSFADEHIPSSVDTEQTAQALRDHSIIAVVGGDTPVLADNISARNSWPGEIISSQLSHIQPQREGIITDWRVHIGDKVSVGSILGKISAPLATPELTAMLAEKTEALTRAEAEATIADEFALKERERVESLKKSLDGEGGTDPAVSFTAIDFLRKNLENKSFALRSFMERALSNHVLSITNYTDWRSVQFGAVSRQYGILNQNILNSYEVSLLTLVEKLKNTSDIPIENAKNYFDLAVRLANNSAGNESANAFKALAVRDQEDFFEFLSEYREAEAELADKETEYKIMISEKNAVIEKDRTMAHAEVEAVKAAYAKISGEITGGGYIVATRNGTVSALYKKVGDLVSPEMSLAVISGRDSALIVRMKIPHNIKRPTAGEIVSVIRPGFSADVRKAKIIGIGNSLDETGSYMADAVMEESVDWPAGASVRVISPEDSNSPLIRFSSLWWDENSSPNIWKVSETERIFAQKITIGRVLGDVIEVYGGVKNGDRYIVDPTSEIRDAMLLTDLIKDVKPKESNFSEVKELQEVLSGHENH